MSFRSKPAVRKPAADAAIAEPERSSSRRPSGNAPAFVGHKLAPSERLLGQEVTIRLRSGKTFEGWYVNGSCYEMELIIGERRVLIFKHVMDWMAPVDG